LGECAICRNVQIDEMVGLNLRASTRLDAVDRRLDTDRAHEPM